MPTFKIALVTSSHLSSNPRLVKEAKALLSKGYKVQILCAQHINELAPYDLEIFQELDKADIYIIDYRKKGIRPIWFRLLSTIRLQFLKYTKIKSVLLYSRMLPEMKQQLKRIKADLYIAHTIAALPAANWAAKQHNALYAFDAEDYHVGESNDPQEIEDIRFLENEYIPSVAYLSTASPYATERYKQRYPSLQIFTINNVFHAYSSNLKPNNEALKIVWFSQTIGLNRGLQIFLSILPQLNPQQFELHLRGTHDQTIKEALLTKVPLEWKNKVFFYQQCSAKELNNWLYKFDVGLALETLETENRKLCISNKIFQYLSSGLAIIATKTLGQSWVMEKTPESGVLISVQNTETALTQLKLWEENRITLENAKKASISISQNVFNWELEQKEFLAQIKLLSTHAE